MANNFDIDNLDRQKDLWELEKRQSIRRKYETILKLYSLFGLLIAVFGVAYFVSTSLDIDFTKSQQMALIFAGTGIGVSLGSWALLLIRRDRMNYEIKQLKLKHNLSEFIWQWSKFETVSKNVLIQQNKQFNQYSIREIIRQLLRENIIDSADIQLLEDAIQARNMAVHGGGMIPKEVLDKYTRQIEKIIEKITSE